MSCTIAKTISAAAFLGFAILSCPTNLVAQQMDCVDFGSALDRKIQLLEKAEKTLGDMMSTMTIDAAATAKMCTLAKTTVALKKETNKLIDDSKAKCSVSKYSDYPEGYADALGIIAQQILDNKDLCK
jgi:hypothetical protein